MVKIGVDSSGHVRNPPIWFVASRKSKKKGQKTHSIYISVKKHGDLERSCKNWFEKVSAALIYKAVTPVFYVGDVIVVDRDFSPRSQVYIEKYTKKLFTETYPNKPLMANPAIFFLTDNLSEEVKEAHIKTQRVRKKFMIKNEKDPSFNWELEKLK